MSRAVSMNPSLARLLLQKEGERPGAPHLIPPHLRRAAADAAREGWLRPATAEGFYRAQPVGLAAARAALG